MSAHEKLKRIGPGEYEYRGWRITRNDRVATGYYGRWVVGSLASGARTSTLASAKGIVDTSLMRNAESKDESR